MLPKCYRALLSYASIIGDAGKRSAAAGSMQFPFLSRNRKETEIMARTFRKALSLLSALTLLTGSLSMNAYAEESGGGSHTGDPVSVAQIGDTPYASLSAAVSAANEAGEKTTIELLRDITFDAEKALSIDGDITITGPHTIFRGEYDGTFFSVSAGASLTLTGGLTLDGSNDWSLDEEKYEAALRKAELIPTADYEAAQYTVPQENGTIATAYMICVSGGTLKLLDVTIQNNYGKNNCGIVKASAGSAVTLEGVQITHVACTRSSGLAVDASGENITVSMNDDTRIDGNFVGGNHGIFKLYYGATLDFNGGSVTNTRGWSSNGIAIGMYHASVTMRGGEISGNSSLSGIPREMDATESQNHRTGVIYVHSASTFTMTGGTIKNNIGYESGGVDALYTLANSTAIITGGTIIDNTSLIDTGYHDVFGGGGDQYGTAISGGIYTQDVRDCDPSEAIDNLCAKGYTCIPYEESEREDDYIVLPYYTVSYYAVSYELSFDRPFGTPTMRPVCTLVRQEKLYIPEDLYWYEADLFANNGTACTVTDNEKGSIDAWYTQPTLSPDTHYDFGTEVLGNVKLYGEWFRPTRPSSPSRPSAPENSSADEGSNEQTALSAVPSVFSDDHYAYIIGRDDGLIHPEASITRAEVATIFFRLLKDEVRSAALTCRNPFPDVSESAWYNTAVSTMAAMGILKGDADGFFRPDDPITRAEFAAVAARFDTSGSKEGVSFRDIAGHWAESDIRLAAANGWVKGDRGLFRPDDLITRAEAMALINRVLHRTPESEDDLLRSMIVWPDNMDTDKWYYLDVQEATNSHDYARKADAAYEYWTHLIENRDWARLEQ